jgi:hypothetical protein
MLFTAVLGCVLFTQIAMGAPLSGTAPNGVRIQLAIPEGATFYLGDPLVVTLKVENASGSAFSFISPSIERFAYKTMSLQILAPDQTKFREIEMLGIYDGAMKSMPPPKALRLVTVASGKETEFNFVLDYDCPIITSRRWVFPVSGDYVIKASLLVPKRPAEGAEEIAVDTPTDTIESEMLTVHVAPPPNKQDEEAYKELRTLKYDFLVYAPEQFDPETHSGAIGEIGSFVKRHTGSRYANYASFFIGYAGFVKNERGKNREEMQKGFDECQRLISTKALPLAFRPRAATLHSQMLARLSAKSGSR